MAQKSKSKTRNRKARSRWLVTVSGWLVVLLASTSVVGFYLFWSATRRQPAHVKTVQFSNFRDGLPVIAGLTDSTIADDGIVQLYQDEHLLQALMDDIERARSSVHLETFVWWQGEICRQMADLLARKAGEGVEVRVLVDALGGRKMSDEVEQTLDGSGVHLEFFRPPSLRGIASINHRDHRKLVVVDGRVGFVFGHGIAREWTAEHRPTWRDTGLRLQGTVVHHLQSVFLENWLETVGDVPVDDALFPPVESTGQVTTMVTRSSAWGSLSSIELLHKLAIAAAKDELVIQNPYFVPDSDLVDLIAEASRRGVRVRMMVPGEEADSRLTRHAGHVYYEELLEAGVELWEYDRALLHQKVMVVDRQWSHVGSTNFDSRSMEINDEVSVGVSSSQLAGQLLTAFDRDTRHARRIGLDAWADRLWLHRALVDEFAYLFNEQI